MIIGISTTTAKVVTAFATEAGAGTRHNIYNVKGGGGQAGIWMSGMAPATLGDGRIFLVTVRFLAHSFSLSLIQLRNNVIGKWRRPVQWRKSRPGF
jgi:hypothetical protein